MTQKKLYILVGLPASGKTTWAKKQKEDNPNLVIVSSDQIRKELYGDEQVQGDPSKVFTETHLRIRRALNKGHDVIFDATNLVRKHRVNIIDMTRKENADYYCVVFPQTLGTLYLRNREREREVPDYVIEKMVTRFDPPLYTEGYKEITILPPERTIDLVELVYKARNILQNNPYHDFSIGTHCLEAQRKYIVEGGKDSMIANALLYHDIGKIFTKTTPEGSKVSHFYGHEQYGSYLILLKSNKNYSDKEMLELSALVRYHMIPYNIKNKLAKARWEKILGKDLYDKVMIIHHYDKISQKRDKELDPIEKTRIEELVENDRKS